MFHYFRRLLFRIRTLLYGITALEKQIDSASVMAIVGLPNTATDGAVVEVNNYYLDTVCGGGTFYWEADGNKAEHNGGTIIDPTHPAAPDDPRYWASEHDTKDGVWVRRYDGAINVRWFGAHGDGQTTSDEVSYSLRP